MKASKMIVDILEMIGELESSGAPLSFSKLDDRLMDIDRLEMDERDGERETDLPPPGCGTRAQEELRGMFTELMALGDCYLKAETR